MNFQSEDEIAFNSLEGNVASVAVDRELQATLVAPRGKTLRNAIVRFGAQIAAMLINLLATPYIIHQLGVESYGIVGLINSMIAFMAIATTSLTSTVGRNLTFAIEHQEYQKANKEISTAVFGLVRLFAIAFLPLCALSIFIDHLIVVPIGLTSATRVFILFAILSFELSAMSGPLGAAMYARNRLDLSSGASLFRTIFFIAAIVALFNVMGASLTTYGIAMLAASILICFVNLRIHKHLLPTIAISARWFDRSILRGIMSMGSWLTIDQIGAILFLQTSMLVANRVLGPSEAGKYAAISVIPLQLRVLAGLVSGLFGPTQAAIGARGDWKVFSKNLLRFIRLTSLFFALLVGVLCGSAHEILSIWLGNEYGSLTQVTLVQTAYLIITLGISPAWDSILILGKVKLPAIVTLVMGVGNVVLCIILAGKLGLMGIALSGCIMLTLRNSLFTPWYVAHACSMSFWPFFREQCLALVAGGVVALISFGIISFIHPGSLKMLVVSLFISTGIGTLLLLPLGMRTLRQKAY